MIDYHHSLDKYYKPSADYKNLEETMTADLNDKDVVFLIAEENGKTLGYIRGVVESAPEYIKPKKIGVVFDAFVEDNARESGIGKQLFEELKKWFATKKVKHLELSVDARNSAGIAFWKKLGFSDYKLRLRQELND
ncbi:MAG: acyl-CoA N-acyltransferase [Parcubacteria group bacterium Gr01-1014_3]|nr:MAG: acyl-CoA N-acyltransferase [Parcubacteria group bacterium Gr01-1014_3]